MNTAKHLPLRILSLAIAGVMASAALAASPVSVESNKAVLHAGDDAPAYNVRVSYPDGRIVEHQILAKETFAIDPISPGGGMTNGQYQYELTPIVGVAVRSNEAEQVKAVENNVPFISGSFRVADGKVMLPESTPAGETNGQDYGVRLKDIVHADDVIITFSLCVGFDCVNGETFGDDTIRMKENNTRLHFDDTSVDGFPANDWTLVANDSASGGANYLAIEDRTAGRQVFRVTAGAPANSLFVDSSGRVGLKTSTPATELHLADGDSPAVRLEQNGSSGFTAQTWDIAGNETNFFVRDVTNGSRLPFKIRPGASNNALVIGDTGNVGLGILAPTSLLHLRGSGSVLPRLTFDNADTGNPVWKFDISDNDDFRISVDGSGQQEFLLDNQGNLTISGSLITGLGNSCSVGCDRVFSAGFPLEDIAQHATSMWTNGFLPGVGPTDESAKHINLTQKIGGMLNELEKAHIYIEQLHTRLQELEARLESEQ